MGNRIRMRRRGLRDLLRIDGYPTFHRYLVEDAIGRYAASRAAGTAEGPGAGLGSVLAVGASWREARLLRQFPFGEVLLTGIGEPDDETRELVASDPRLRYERQNLEAVALPSRGFDLVFCKETLHHLPRPALGLYETLRLCRRAVLLIEPWESVLGRLLAAQGLASIYESGQAGNLLGRDNYVYRWSRRQLVSILNSYYLESGYELELTLGWLSSRANAAGGALVRPGAALLGWLLSFLPGARGNLVTALIRPGRDLPPDPAPLQTRAATQTSEKSSGQAQARAWSARRPSSERPHA